MTMRGTIQHGELRYCDATFITTHGNNIKAELRTMTGARRCDDAAPELCGTEKLRVDWTGPAELQPSKSKLENPQLAVDPSRLPTAPCTIYARPLAFFSRSKVVRNASAGGCSSSARPHDRTTRTGVGVRRCVDCATAAAAATSCRLLLRCSRFGWLLFSGSLHRAGRKNALGVPYI
jgi:hypothetical protein